MADAFCSNTEAENEKEQVRSLTAPEGRAQSGELTYTGGCHCQAVRFECQAPSVLECWDCNCSICRMKQNTHFMVPEEKFTLQQGEGKLTTYTFNTGVAKHTFCQVRKRGVWYSSFLPASFQPGLCRSDSVLSG